MSYEECKNDEFMEKVIAKFKSKKDKQFIRDAFYEILYYIDCEIYHHPPLKLGYMLLGMYEPDYIVEMYPKITRIINDMQTKMRIKKIQKERGDKL